MPDALYHGKIAKLVWAANELRRIADHITPTLAPQSAKKIRSAIKSVDGAIRHAQSMAGREQREADLRYKEVQKETIQRIADKEAKRLAGREARRP